MTYQIGDNVFIPASANSYWTGVGKVTGDIEGGFILVRMFTGKATGKTGGFVPDDLRPHSISDSVMEIVSIKRTKHRDTGLKVYGQVLGESGKTYRFAYFRRKTFRGWICSCDNFMMSQFAKGLNCKHLQFVRNQVGRYAASVPKSTS
jgi:hypothetical protein